MKRTLWLLALLLLLCPCVQAQDFVWEDFASWQVTFYELDSTVTVQVDTFMQGDTIKVLWRQPLPTRPWEEQPGPSKFPNTGRFINLSASRQDIGLEPDGRVRYKADATLTPGRWAIGIKAVLVEKETDGSNIVSKQGGWYPIYIGRSSKLPPDMPVSISVELLEQPGD